MRAWRGIFYLYDTSSYILKHYFMTVPIIFKRFFLALAQFMAPIEIYDYDDVAAQHYGKIHAHLERQGTPIGSLDMLIAAHALSIDCVLITNNESEFRRVSNLKIENWVK